MVAEPVKLSIVIAASNSPVDLEACLTSLRGQGEEDATEIIAVSNYDEGIEKLLAMRFPWVRSVILPTDTIVPELRTLGILQSRGEIVALIEDNCVVHESWCAEIKKAHALPSSVVGGAVEHSGRRWIDWAVYFYEYGKYMLPSTPGPAASLAGNNVSYKRDLLERLRPLFRDGFFEAFIHWELQRLGHILYMAPAAIVYHSKEDAFINVLIRCFHHGRSLAGKRRARVSMVKRLLFLGGSCILPVLLIGRIMATVYRKRRRIREAWMALPYLSCFMTSWALGEFCGYSAGEGESTRRWT